MESELCIITYVILHSRKLIIPIYIHLQNPHPSLTSAPLCRRRPACQRLVNCPSTIPARRRPRAPPPWTTKHFATLDCCRPPPNGGDRVTIAWPRRTVRRIESSGWSSFRPCRRRRRRPGRWRPSTWMMADRHRASWVGADVGPVRWWDAAGAGAGWASAADGGAGVAADCPFCCSSGALSSVIRALRI